MNPGTKSVLYDLLAALIFLAAAVAFGAVSPSMQGALFAIVVLGFILGLLRGNSALGYIWLDAILINILILPAGILLSLMTWTLVMLLLPAGAYLATLTGLYIRSHWARLSTVLRFGIPLILAGATVLVGMIILPEIIGSKLSRQVSIPAPRFDVALIDGARITSDDLAGRVTMIDFWATWCGPCKKEFPEVKRIYEKYRDNSDFLFLTINRDEGGEALEKVKTFLNDNGYAFATTIDSAGVCSDAFDVHSLPTLLLIDRKGNIRYTHKGYDSSENLVKNISKNIDALLAENHKAM